METKRPQKYGGYQEGQENNGSHVLWQTVHFWWQSQVIWRSAGLAFQ